MTTNWTGSLAAIECSVNGSHGGSGPKKTVITTSLAASPVSRARAAM